MSDIPIEPLPSDAESTPSDPPLSPEPPPRLFSDEQMVEIAAGIAPLIEAAMTAAIQTAIESTPVPIFRPGTATAIDHIRAAATVSVDGDTATTITAQILGERPTPGDRVLVLQAPGGAVWCYLIGHSGLPPGSVWAYLGRITTDSPSSASSYGPPPGTARPYGQITTQSKAPGLYAAVGTTYNTSGENAAIGEFRMPDCRGLIFIGLDNMGGSDRGKHSLANTVGTVGGQNTITTAMLPSHTHDLSNHTHTVNSHDHSGPNHNHSGPNHNHSIGGVGDHSHGGSSGNFLYSGGGGNADLTADSTYGPYNEMASTGNAGGHDHGGGTGYASGDTGYASGTTGSASPGTNGPSNNTSGSAGTGAEHLPPVMVCHWLIKI